jgi:biopolymer transport protein TolR
MGPLGNNSDLMAEINVTPFVDVMLVLLIIFMVTAPMMVQGINVALPEAAAGAIDTEEESLLLSIDKEGGVFINDVRIELDFLQQKLGKILEGRKSRDVYLSADRAVPYGIVVSVMAEIKNAGVEKLGMVTEPPKEKKKPGK